MTMHHARKIPTSFVASLEMLLPLLGEDTTPTDIADGLLEVLKRLEKCLFVKTQLVSTTVAIEPDAILQPSDLFLHYVSAFRARDWPQVRIIEHDFRS